MKKAYLFQSLALLAGVAFAWYTIVNDFLRFANIEGTIFKIKDCSIPNPVVTACFYGGFAFIIAFLWSIYIINQTNFGKRAKHQARLIWLLIASVLFAWTNFTIEALKIWSPKPGQIRTCTPGANSPFETACFIGASIFTIALLSALYIKYKERKALPPQN